MQQASTQSQTLILWIWVSNQGSQSGPVVSTKNVQEKNSQSKCAWSWFPIYIYIYMDVSMFIPCHVMSPVPSFQHLWHVRWNQEVATSNKQELPISTYNTYTGCTHTYIYIHIIYTHIIHIHVYIYTIYILYIYAIYIVYVYILYTYIYTLYILYIYYNIIYIYHIY